MKIQIDNDVRDATPEEEAEIVAAQEDMQKDNSIVGS